MTPAVPNDLVRVVTEQVGDRLHARLAGEIDMSNAGAVGDQLREASRGAQEVYVDLAGLTFMDSSALRVLVGLRNDLLAGGRSLTVTTPSGSRAARILAVSGVDRVLGVSFEAEREAVPDPRG